MKQKHVLVLSAFLGLAFISLAGADPWAKKANMPTPRGYLATCAVNGRIYAIGGWLGGIAVSSAVEEYDPVTNTWTKKADMPTARDGPSAVEVNGKIYVIGGIIEATQTLLSTVEEYDPVKDTWTRKADMPTPRGCLSTAVVDGKIYAIGGYSWTNVWKIEEYDPVKNTWIRKADILQDDAGLANSAPVVNGRIYVFGGKQSRFGPVLSTVKEYDPVTDTWARKSDMTAARWNMGVVEVNGKIYVIGGNPTFDDVSGLQTVEEYDPATDRWTGKSSLPTRRYALSASVANGKIYAIGGCSEGDIPTSIVEEYNIGLEGASVEAKGKLATLWGSIKK